MMGYGAAGRTVTSPAIYIPFNLRNVRSLFDREHVYEATVHELSHHLWCSTPGHHESKNEIFRSWEEGFAVFLESNLFSGIVPEGKPSRSYYHNPIYDGGFRKGIYVAVMHGIDAFWRIPAEWEKFEEMYQRNPYEIVT